MSKSVVTTAFIKMATVIGLVGALGLFTDLRFRHAGDWLPTVPDSIGRWEGINTPLGAETLSALGNPQALGRKYVNPFGEEVIASIVSAGPFENYHDPTICVTGNGFFLTGVKTFPLDGPGSGNVRAMIFKRTDIKYGDIRILMYYWQQNRDGSTDTAARMGTYKDMDARLRTGYGAVVQGQQTCLARIYTIIGPEDPQGIQAQRNVDEVARTWYRALKKSGVED